MHRRTRRFLFLGVTLAVALAAWKRFVQGPHSSTPGAPVTYAGSSGAGTTPTSATAPATAPMAATPASTPKASARPGAFTVVSQGPTPWVPPVDGACPEGYPIKANDKSGIFHVPGGRFYDRTVPERCYADADAAVADGYRQAKA